jgi:hypothetical protein
MEFIGNFFMGFLESWWVFENYSTIIKSKENSSQFMGKNEVKFPSCQNENWFSKHKKAALEKSRYP